MTSANFEFAAGADSQRQAERTMPGNHPIGSTTQSYTVQGRSTAQCVAGCSEYARQRQASFLRTTEALAFSCRTVRPAAGNGSCGKVTSG